MITKRATNNTNQRDKINPNKDTHNIADGSDAQTYTQLTKDARTIDTSLKYETWRLEPALKRARLYDPSVATDDIKQRRAPTQVQPLGSPQTVRGVPRQHIVL